MENFDITFNKTEIETLGLVTSFTINELLHLANDCDNTLALAIHQLMLSQSSRPQCIEERIFDEGYEAGWNDCIMKASNAIDNLEK